MKNYRAAILGGRRGVHHAAAYKGLENMEVVAICEADNQRRKDVADLLNMAAYENYEEMLEKEQPDIVHVVTMPTIPRHIWIKSAAKVGVQALVIEKPIALRPRETELLDLVEQETKLKIIVNHQRRYLPFADQLRQFQSDKSLGQIHFVRASTEGEITDMDTHLMDLVLLAVGDVAPTAVWAAIDGGETYDLDWLNCPENLMATYTFGGGIRAFFESTRAALGSADFPSCNPRCNIDIWATKGRIWWRENGSWGYLLNNTEPQFVQPTNFGQDDILAQRRFTQAIATWLQDDSRPHYCRYSIAKLGFNAIMSAYRSALKGRRLDTNFQLTDDEWEELRKRLIPPQRV